MVLVRVRGGTASARLARPGTKPPAPPRPHLPGGVRHVRLGRLAVAVILFGFAHPAWAAGERMALVIGNSQYERQPLLPNTTADADAVAGVLDRMGFAVERHENLGRKALVGAVLAFADRSREADVALVYYAGHGVQVARDGVGENYLVPVDARLGDVRTVADETVPLSRVLDELGGRPGVLVVLLDACRDNPLAAQMAGHGTRAVTRSGLALVPDAAVSQGSLLAFAAAPGKVALDGDGPNGPFATALVKNLPVRGVDVGRVMQWVALDVEEATGRRQRPEVVNRLRRRDELYLAGPAQAAPARPAPAPAAAQQAVPPGPAPANPTTPPAAPSARAIAEAGWAAEKAGNLSEAVRLYRLAADQGDAAAQTNLGVMYEAGRGGLPRSDTDAVRLYRLAADQGYAAAQANLGVMYADGRGGLPRSDTDAVRLFRLAADQGNATGQAYLGDMYMGGRGGLQKSDTDAVRLYRRAADQGNARGQTNLGFMYEKGRGGLTRDPEEAVRLYRLAAAQNDWWARNRLQQLGIR